MRAWIIDGNNVYGSRPDGWWNDRQAAATRFAQSVAEWCRTHGDDVLLVFDAPVAAATFELAGGNLTIAESPRRGRDAADDHIVDVAHEMTDVTAVTTALTTAGTTGDDPAQLTVVTSDRRLRARLPDDTHVVGAGRFLEIIAAA